MQSLDNNTQAFFALVRAGLWGNEARLSQYTNIDFNEVYRLSVEQSVIGLVLAGLEHSDMKPPQELLLQWIGEMQMIEQRNKAMNSFVVELIERLRKDDIYALLVKGQGVAQCYEKPLWRTSGDVDLLLSDDNYEGAKKVLMPIADEVANEYKVAKHQALVINGFDVELHGKMPFSLSKRADKVLVEVLNGSMTNGGVSAWRYNDNDIFLPLPDQHLLIVFTHYLLHFFIEGVGLRQICDWCRMLWTYQDFINVELLENRLRKMGLMSEWRAFASLAVDYLGMPESLMPFYDYRYRRKGYKVSLRILKSGNFGHNNDFSYRLKFSELKYKLISLRRRFKEFVSLSFIFPFDAPRFFVTYVYNKARK